MHRLAFKIPHRAPVPSLSTSSCMRVTGAARLHALFPGRAYATSSPKEAEAASAQSGGSRSKDAAESAAGDAGDAGNLGATRGRTGGGEPLESSVNPPPRPKVRNASVPLGKGKDALSPEQQEEVDRHNADFDKRYDRAESAAEDKVDKDFWKGNGGRERK